MRIRFLTSYPSNISTNLLEVVKKHSNICKHFHIPLQSGSTRIFSLMMRKYTVAEFLLIIKMIKKIIPDCSIYSDIMLQKSHSFYRLKENLGKIQKVLIEGISKKDENYYYGRNSKNDIIVFPKNKSKIGS
ncbi:MAG: hypothetical protein ACEOLT_00310 [Candidatus Karelsulcia muelleri]